MMNLSYIGQVLIAIFLSSGSPSFAQSYWLSLWLFLRTKFTLPPQPLALQEQNQRDLELLNRHAERLNEEALDVLAYQIAI